MVTETSSQGNIADVVAQSEEEISHFRFSPFLSKVYKLRGVNIGAVTDVEDAEYSLNLGLVSRATEIKKSANIGVLLGGGNSSKSSFNFGGIGVGFDYMEKSSNICGIVSPVNDLKDSLNVSCFMADIENSENSENIGIIAAVVRKNAKNSVVAGAYTRVENRLADSVEFGVINYAFINLGRQIGLVNICRSRKGEIEGKEAKGKSMGLVNIDLDKPWYDSVSFFYR